MKCTDVRDLAPLYLTGELESARAEQLAAHVRFCPPCALELGYEEALEYILGGGGLPEHYNSSRFEIRFRLAIARPARPYCILALPRPAALFLLLLGVRTV